VISLVSVFNKVESLYSVFLSFFFLIFEKNIAIFQAKTLPATQLKILKKKILAQNLIKNLMLFNFNSFAYFCMYSTSFNFIKNYINYVFYKKNFFKKVNNLKKKIFFFFYFYFFFF
jgi:hypothetical protein